MTRRFAYILVSLAAPAWAAAEVGTCRTATGVLVAPWTDDADPACGEDCAQAADLALDTALCDAAGCEVAATETGFNWPGQPERALEPEPSGPRCLEPGPECAPGAPGSAGVPMAAAAVGASPAHVPAPRPGLLPGAGAPTSTSSPCERTHAPEPRPPR